MIISANVIMHLSKPIECKMLRVNGNGNYELELL